MRYDITDEERKAMENQFVYHPPTKSQLARYQAIRDVIHDTTIKIKQMTPKSREQSVALTNLETAMFWANAAIARNEKVEDFEGN